MKMKIKLLGLMFFLGGFLNNIIAQNITITGTVKNKTTGDAMQGATVSIEKTTKSTQTNATGDFSITAQQGNVLIISFVGFTSEKRKVTKAENITISLEETSKGLEDVVVIGYGTQKITKISGAISTVKSDVIEKLKPVRVEEALQGTISGVNVIQNGSPGSTPTVFIRGISSYTGNSPLVVIDGVMQDQADLNSISPADVESINVLKDAAMTAIYGVKGGNGVILVTTKSGKKNQKTEFNVTMNYGIQETSSKMGVLNASEYGAIVNEGSTLAGGSILFSDISKLGVGTNWQDQVFKQAPSQVHSISVKGGSEKTTYFLSGTYNSQGGIVGGIEKSVFNRGNLTANINFDLSSKCKLILNTSAVILSSKFIQENDFNSILGSAINFDPTVPIYNTVPNTIGSNGFSKNLIEEIYNPVTKLDNTYNKNNGFKLYGKLEFQYQILKNLKLSSRFGYTKYDDNFKEFTPLVFWGLNNTGNTLDYDGSTKLDRHNSVTGKKYSNFNFTGEAFINYNFKIKDDHHFETVLGISLARTSGNALNTYRQDVPFNSWTFADVNAATGVNTSTNPNAVSGGYYEYFGNNASGFARVNYDYKDKYLASFSIRNDGSDKFGKANKFAIFTSGSLGWVVSKENFFTCKAIDVFKIRGSYGTVGNDGAVAAYYAQIITGGPSYGSTGNSNGYTFGDVFYNGSTVGSLKNDALKWETDFQGNIGFDMILFKNKIAITFDYYTKGAKDLLFNPLGSLYLGTIPPSYVNIGTTKTSGIDLQIAYNTTVGKSLTINNTFSFTTIKNLVTYTNEVDTKITNGKIFNGQTQYITRFQKDYSPGFFYGYKTEGLFQTNAEIAAAPTQNGAKPGDIRFADVNKDGIIDDNDRTQIGDPFPKVTMGWNITIEYKNIDFTAFAYASIGNEVFRAYERNSNFTNKDRSVLARWTGAGTTNNAKYPRYTFQDDNNNIRASDRYVEDGSFIKIKNIQLGYTFPASITKKLFSKLRIYAQVKNAFTFTKYGGLDPEIGGGVFDTGIDRGAYPQARTYAIGIDIKL
jgi:TonB-dependent starch-binding outer membrane protein SusC